MGPNLSHRPRMKPAKQQRTCHDDNLPILLLARLALEPQLA
jgi:hypothetical protein